MSYLLRLVLPDRPGVLGAVATALGRAGADILSVDVIERSTGYAIDDLVLELAPDKLADSLVSAAVGIEGVQVESIQPYAGHMDAHRELELLDGLATRPEHSFQVLADGVARIFRAGWALVLQAPGAARLGKHRHRARGGAPRRGGAARGAPGAALAAGRAGAAQSPRGDRQHGDRERHDPVSARATIEA